MNPRMLKDIMWISSIAIEPLSVKKYVPYFPAHKTHQPIRRTVNFSLEILEKK